MQAELLQSPLWADVQKADGRGVFYVNISNDNGKVDSCLIIKHQLPFGKSWLYSPRPIVQNEEQWKVLFPKIEALAKQEGAIFWKVEGVEELRIKNYELRITKNSSPLQYQETFILDLSKTEEDLLKNMKPKTRYNINLAQKRDVTVQWSKNIKDVNIFYDLLIKTRERQKIGIHLKEHYSNIIKILGEPDSAAFIFAYHNNQPIAANLVTFFGDTATYLHGGTDSRYRALMAPYLLQWDGILETKRRGLRYYDLGGVAVTRGKISEWSGITRFKQGFGGELVQLGETYDVVFDKLWYQFYKIGVSLVRLW